jgi:PTS system nitrogen regulatory IIA component
MLVNQEEKWEKLKIADFLSPNAITIDLAATTKRAAIEELVGILAREGRIKDAKATFDVLWQRETIGTTGIGQGIAMPHAKTDQANDLVAALGLSRRGVQFDSLDEQPVHIIFLLVTPPQAAGLHIKALSRISQVLRHKFVRQALRGAKDAGEALKIIRDEDQY